MPGSEAERQEANVTPPTCGTTPGTNITCLATSTSSATHDLGEDSEFYGRYIDVTADGGTIHIAFDNDSTGSINDSLAGASIAAGTTEAACWPIRDGEVRSFRLSKGLHRYLHTKASTGTPRLILCGSSQGGRLR